MIEEDPFPIFPGTPTPQEGFYVPILQILDANEQGLAIYDIKNILKDQMNLTSFDHRIIYPGTPQREEIWEKSVRDAQYTMETKGFIKLDHTNKWRINEQGRMYLADMRAVTSSTQVSQQKNGKPARMEKGKDNNSAGQKTRLFEWLSHRER